MCRHVHAQVGFMLVDELARQVGATLDKLQHNAAAGRGRFCGKRVLLAKPMTFMNNSGEAVGWHAILRYAAARNSTCLELCKWGARCAPAYAGAERRPVFVKTVPQALQRLRKVVYRPNLQPQHRRGVDGKYIDVHCRGRHYCCVPLRQEL